MLQVLLFALFQKTFICDEKWIMCNNRTKSAKWFCTDEFPRFEPKPNFHSKKWSATRLTQQLQSALALIILNDNARPHESSQELKNENPLEILSIHYILQIIRQQTIKKKYFQEQGNLETSSSSFRTFHKFEQLGEWNALRITFAQNCNLFCILIFNKFIVF